MAAERLDVPSDQRTFPVSLRQISLEERLKAAQQLNSKGDHDGEDLLATAWEPSATVYWLRESARPIFDRVKKAA